MNERIKQLAEQAYEDVIKNTPSFLVTKELYEQKFAQLIVRECIWAFGETRTEPSLEKYILDRLGIIK
jgi:hypothetical protein